MSNVNRASVPVIDDRQAGFLRRMPGQRDVAIPAGAATRYGWPALARDGLALVEGGRYRRSMSGERALAAYDVSLPEEEVTLLRLVRDEPARMRGNWGVQRLVGAGLAGIGTRSSGTPAVTEAGLDLLAARREPVRSRAA